MIKTRVKILSCLLLAFCISRQASALQCRSLFADAETKGITSRDRLLSLFGFAQPSVRFYHYTLTEGWRREHHQNSPRPSQRLPLKMDSEGTIVVVYDRSLGLPRLRIKFLENLEPELTKFYTELEFFFDPITGIIIPSKTQHKRISGSTLLHTVYGDTTIRALDYYISDMTAPPKSGVNFMLNIIENFFSTSHQDPELIEWTQVIHQEIHTPPLEVPERIKHRRLELRPVTEDDLLSALNYLYYSDM